MHGGHASRIPCVTGDLYGTTNTQVDCMRSARPPSIPEGMKWKFMNENQANEMCGESAFTQESCGGPQLGGRRLEDA